MNGIFEVLGENKKYIEFYNTARAWRPRARADHAENDARLQQLNSVVSTLCNSKSFRGTRESTMHLCHQPSGEQPRHSVKSRHAKAQHLRVLPLV
jgi:hypothetical protein